MAAAMAAMRRSTRTRSGYVGVTRRPNGRFDAVVHEHVVASFGSAYEAGCAVAFHLRRHAAMEPATLMAWDPVVNSVCAGLYGADAATRAAGRRAYAAAHATVGSVAFTRRPQAPSSGSASGGPA